MDIILQLFLVFIIGLIASFINGLGGSGGLLSIPFLIFTGIPPQIALATQKMGAIGYSVGGMTRFAKAKKIVWKYAIIFGVIGILSGIIGAKMLLSINSKWLPRIISIVILITIPCMFIKKDFGLKRKVTSMFKKIIGGIIYFLLMIFGALISGGTGPFFILNSTYFFGLTLIESNATNTLPWLIVSTTSLIVFAIAGIVNWKVGIALFLGMILGGYIGAHTAVKKGEKWIKIVMVVLMVLTAAKLLFF